MKQTKDDYPFDLGEKRDVLISIKGLSGTDEDGENIELVTGGQYSFEGRRAAFEYMESELTGMKGTKTSICVEPDSVMVVRSGTVNMQMLFQEGRKNYFNYNTPYGSMTMGLATQCIINELTGQGGRLEVRYMMDVDSAMTTRNKVEIEIMNKGRKG